MRKNWWMILLLSVLALFGTAYEVHGQSFTQWAITASASSEYGSINWSAQQLLGQPNVYPNYGDSGYAWASAEMNSGRQWVELGFLEAVYVEHVDIYETFNPGAIVNVELVDTKGNSHLIWEAEGGPAATAARVLSVRNVSATVPAKGVRITVDTDSVSGWNELDAVSITGSYTSPWPQASGESDMLVQWASGAKASSQYREDRWAPEQMTGRPDVYPKYGDYDTAWVASTSNGGEEWVDLFYDEAVYAKRIDVYETCNPGAIVKAEIIDETGRPHVVWVGRAQVAPEESRIFSIDNINVDMPTRHVRLVLQTDQVPGWNEIDAVCLVGSRTTMEEANVMGPLERLASVLLRLEMAVERGREESLADSAFLHELEQILRELSNIGF